MAILIIYLIGSLISLITYICTLVIAKESFKWQQIFSSLLMLIGSWLMVVINIIRIVQIKKVEKRSDFFLN